jgi:hypothetical protein
MANNHHLDQALSRFNTMVDVTFLNRFFLKKRLISLIFSSIFDPPMSSRGGRCRALCMRVCSKFGELRLTIWYVELMRTSGVTAVRILDACIRVLIAKEICLATYVHIHRGRRSLRNVEIIPIFRKLYKVFSIIDKATL